MICLQIWRNCSTNQRPCPCGNSVEHDQYLIMIGKSQNEYTHQVEVNPLSGLSRNEGKLPKCDAKGIHGQTDNAILMSPSDFVSSKQKYVHVLCDINSLWPGDVIWRHGTRLTLAQVMACYLTAPRHYLNQCWLIISEVPWHSSQGIILRWFEDTNH